MYSLSHAMGCPVEPSRATVYIYTFCPHTFLTRHRQTSFSSQAIWAQATCSAAEEPTSMPRSPRRCAICGTPYWGAGKCANYPVCPRWQLRRRDFARGQETLQHRVAWIQTIIVFLHYLLLVPQLEPEEEPQELEQEEPQCTCFWF